MYLAYRFKRMLYLRLYLSFQANVSPGPENELVLGGSESIDLSIGCWEVQLAVLSISCTTSAVTLMYEGGTGLPCHRRSGYTMPEATSILNDPLLTGTYNLQPVGPVIESTGNFPKGSA